MGFYFDYVIERKNKDKWVCVSKSSFDYELNLLNVGLLKETFDDTEFYEGVKSIEKELTDDSFMMFGRKIDRFSSNVEKDYPYQYSPTFDEMKPFSIQMLEMTCNGKLRNNDLILWFSIKNLLSYGKDILKNYVHHKDMNYDKNEADKINSEKSLINEMKNWKNCVYDESRHLLGINFECSPYALEQILLYSVIFKNTMKLCPLEKLIVGMSTVRYMHNKKEIMQWKYNASVSYPKQIKMMIDEINKEIRHCDMSTYIENESKKQVMMILDRFKGDKSENNSMTYRKLKEWCETNVDVADIEYADELKERRNELEFIMKIMGDNGRMIWSIQ